MSADLPKVRSSSRSRRMVMWAFIGVALVLVAAIVLLLVGTPLLDDAPTSDLERDYLMLSEALKDNPESPAVLMTLAETAYELGKTGEAMDYAAKAVEFSGDEQGLSVRYAQLLLLEGDLEAAEEQARREIELDVDKQNAGARFILGQILAAGENYEEALEVMKAGLDIDYTAADMRVIYAEILVKAGDDAAAVEEFRTVLLFLPDNQRAIDGLALLGIEYEASETTNPHEATSTDTP